MVFFKRLIAGLAVVATVLFIFGCAATEKNYKTTSSDESANIDQLLGVGNAGTEGEINEDDVLKLLGVSDETKTETSSSEQAMASTENAESQITTKYRVPAADQAADGKTDRTDTSLKSDLYYDRYQDALQSYRSKNFREAIQKFEALLAADSKNNLADNCQYWIGESYYDLQNYQQAIVAFEKVFTYAKSNKDDSAQLKLGMCYLRLNEKGKAKEEFQKLVQDYPVSEYVGIAKRFIGQIDGTASAP